MLLLRRRQSAIAGKASSTAKGYLLGSFLFMPTTFILPLSAGIFAVATDLPVSLDEAFEGLILPASLYTLMGKGGMRSGLLRMHPVMRMHSPVC